MGWVESKNHLTFSQLWGKNVFKSLGLHVYGSESLTRWEEPEEVVSRVGQVTDTGDVR